MKSLRSVGTLMVVAGLATTARANLLINGMLESAVPPKQPDNLVYVTPSTNPTALTGWTLDSGEIDIVPNSYFQSSQGNYSVDLVGTPGLGSISQQVATTATAEYALTFDFSINPESGPLKERPYIKTLRVEAIGADGVTVLATQDFSETRGTRTNSNMQWTQKTLTFFADGSVATIRFSALEPSNLPSGVTGSMIFTGPVIDNVDLVLGGGSIPEPASVGILGVAAVGLLMRRRRV
jgi:choice-of-anchor C domain-containing protein